MPPITRTDTDEVFDKNGNVVASKQVVRDVTAETNAKTLKQQASTALGKNTTFLGLASPTNAQSLAQVQALTRQVNGLIRLGLEELDEIDPVP